MTKLTHFRLGVAHIEGILSVSFLFYFANCITSASLHLLRYSKYCTTKTNSAENFCSGGGAFCNTLVSLIRKEVYAVTTQALISGYANYTTPSAVSTAVAEDAPAISPTATVTTSSQACITTISMTVTATIDTGC